MVYSNKRKLLLSGWLKENGSVEYNTPLKLQKYLLFYELFAKIDGDNYDLSSLKGYKRGPVFSTVWGDYTHERSAFDAAAAEEYAAHHDEIDIDRAKRSCFIVSTLSERELSTFTHKLNLWNSKRARIMQGEQQVELHESDFSTSDAGIIGLLEQMYPISLINNSHVISVDNHYFVFNKQDAERLSENHFDTLVALADNKDLVNPVYVDLDAEGRLIVD